MPRMFRDFAEASVFCPHAASDCGGFSVECHSHSLKAALSSLLENKIHLAPGNALGNLMVG